MRNTRSLLVGCCAFSWVALSQLSGCASDNASTARGDVSEVAVGMTRSQVISILGPPQKLETFGPTEFLFYRSGYGEDLPIAVVEGKVSSIGRGAYEIVVKSKAVADRTGAVR